MKDKTTQVIGWGMMPCLHCGEVIKMEKDIHFCKAPKNEWLNRQGDAYMEIPGVGIWDLKTKKVVKRYVTNQA